MAGQRGDNPGVNHLHRRWASPPRHGMQLMISPWEYRHLRGFARLRMVSGTTLAGLGLVTLAFGGSDAETYGWASAFLAASAANLAFGAWEMSIAESPADGTT